MHIDALRRLTGRRELLWFIPTAERGAVISVLFVALLARVLTGPLVSDDAYITLRYGVNLAAGQGLTFNPPAHVLGTSSPLFATGIAVAVFFHADPESAAVAASIVADIVTLAVLAAILARAGFAEGAILSISSLATLPALVMQTASGMETSVYMMLVVLTLFAITERLPTCSGILCGLASLIRPEGGLLAVAVVSVWAFERPRDAIRCGVIASLLCVPCLIVATRYYGSPLPSSVVAKAAARPSEWVSGRAFANFFFHGHYAVLSVLGILGSISMWKSRATALRAACAWWLLYVAFFLAVNGFGRFTWYYVPSLPVYFAASACGLWTVLRYCGDRVTRFPYHRVVLWALCILVLVTGAMEIVPLRAQFRSSLSAREGVYREIAGRIAADGECECPILATEIGTLGYFYPGPIEDAAGLVSPELIGLPVDSILRRTKACWLVSDVAVIDAAVTSSSWFRERFVRSASPPLHGREIAVYRRIG
jgi:hypothetical protein